MKIFGISGTNGAGKDSLIDLLVAEYGFFAVSATDMLADSLRQKGWPIDREHKSKLSAEWRRQHGMGAIVDEAWQRFLPVKQQYQGFVVGSLRHPGEAERIHELGGKVIWIDADPKVRYERIRTANRGANKAAEDNKTFVEFLAEQEREMHPVGDSATLNMAGVKELADILIMNNANNVQAFQQQAVEDLGL